MHIFESCLGDWSWWVDMIWLIRLMRQVVVIGCLDRLWHVIWHVIGTGWCTCMVDALGAWLMHLFMVQVQVVWYRLVHGWCTCLWYRLITGWGTWLMHGSGYWYRLFGAGWLVQFTTVYLTVIVWQWFHHSTSTSGRLDGARTGGCSHLPIVAGEHRGS
jgi:hypothetical protein